MDPPLTEVTEVKEAGPSPDSTAGTPSAAHDVLLVGASAGGLPAILSLLRGLPAGWRLPVVVMQHVAPNSALEPLLARAGYPAARIEPGTRLTAGHLHVCPPRSLVDLLPDGSFALDEAPNAALDYPIDRLFDSAARSFGARAIGVILSGMGRDGAAGCCHLHAAGGRVLAQTPGSAEYPDMPRAAIDAGAVDLVVPAGDLGQVIGELVAGTARPQAHCELQAVNRVFGHWSAVAETASETDWSQSPLGAVLGWPDALKLAVRTVIASPRPAAIWWGDRLCELYNDAWCDFLGGSPLLTALGQPASHAWLRTWAGIVPMAEHALYHGEAAVDENVPVMVERHGFVEEVHATVVCTPVRDLNGEVHGVHVAIHETTRNVVAERRLRTLGALATGLAGAANQREACMMACNPLSSNPADLPFALIYLLDDEAQQAALVCVAGAAAGSSVAPHVIYRGDAAGWPLSALLQARSGAGRLLVEDLARRFPELGDAVARPRGMDAPARAMMVPLRTMADDHPMGVLIAGISPHLPLDNDYRNFIDVIAEGLSAELGHARARELQRRQNELLSELDRTKTEFFSNMSHEFRTPLTLLLAPLEELVRARPTLPAGAAGSVETAARNARRLLRLVNHLLDFSEIETRGQQVAVEPADIGALTRDIASAFRSAFEAAGLHLEVEIDPKLPTAMPLNPEMWEKIVSNLLSNALKFTFEGGVSVRLSAQRMHAELVVADTGVGIPERELPNIFKRFHRVRGARARTAEGSGIGLAIVHDLVRRMSGQVTVRSAAGSGTRFTIWLPYKPTRVVAEAPQQTSARPHTLALDLASEATSWVDGSAAPFPDIADDLLDADIEAAPPGPRARLLVVDDNADVRDYLRRLLGKRWDVRALANGEAALAEARAWRPDAMLVDVMMPGMDGAELLRRIRADASLKTTPVMLVTARAGDQAVIDGLLAGADDYVAKPFSPRELVARVQATLERARADAALRASEAWQSAQKEAFQAALSGATIQESLEPLHRAMLALAGPGLRCAFYMADDSRSKLHHVLGMTEDYAQCVDGFRIAADSIACGLAACTGRPVITPDVEREPNWAAWTWLAAAHGYRAVWSFPIAPRGGNAVGTFAMYFETPREATARERDWAAIVTHAAAIIISRAVEAAERSRAETALREAARQAGPA